VINSRRIRCSDIGEIRNAYEVLVGKPEAKRSFERPRCRREENIKMDVKETGCEGVDWV
jgi:hypothetical protein